MSVQQEADAAADQPLSASCKKVWSLDGAGSKNRLDAWHSGACTANGIDIHYVRSGGAKPSLLALHGLIGSGACLAPLAHELEHRFDVILPDARGHGRSSAPAAGYSYSDLADDAASLIGELKLNATVLLGHSMGGLTAALVASRRGSKIAALVLVDPTFIGPEWQRAVSHSDIAEQHRKSCELSRIDLLAQARLRSPHRSEEMIGYLVDARFRTSAHAFQVLAPPNPDYRDIVRKIPVPTLLVIGDRGVVSVETAFELQELNPLLRFEMLSDVGHGMPYDAPQSLGVVISSFLRDSAASTMMNSSA